MSVDAKKLQEEVKTLTGANIAFAAKVKAAGADFEVPDSLFEEGGCIAVAKCGQALSKEDITGAYQSRKMGMLSKE